MAGEHATLLFTSPPYGSQRDYATGGVADWDALMRGVFGAMVGALRADGAHAAEAKPCFDQPLHTTVVLLDDAVHNSGIFRKCGARSLLKCLNDP
jgi:hypothetical protein